MLVYQHNSDGYYLYPFEFPGGPLPANCVMEEPTLVDGLIPRWNGDKWEQVEDHKGEQGYLDGEPFTVNEYGPLPEGFSLEPLPPSPEEQKQSRVTEIKSRLAEIDLESVRPLRAKVHGTATQEDDAKLTALETEAEALRAELAGL